MKSEISPAYLLVDYAWAVLSKNMPKVWDKKNYGGLLPMVPLNEEPELDEYNGPHIVYGFSEDMTGDAWFRSSGATTFAVYDDSFRRLTETLNVLRVAFERQDDTARDVNEFTTFFDPDEDGTFQYLGLRFGTIDISFVESGTPEDGEGGRQSALLGIKYEYYVDYDVITNP